MRINASRRSRKIALAATVASLAIFLADPALAQTSPADEDTSASDTADSIVVIGTRRTDRSVTNSASPVDVIGAQELANQPAANMLDVVKNIVPSFFVGQNSISDASTFVRAPSLRGLPADEILVMLDGKRFNRSALVQVYTGGDTALSFGSQGSDISAIPAIAVKNLQVLRDGATAQYGSDAIGGVLNYGLRDDAGFELQGRYGQYFDKGDGKSKQISANVGFKLGDRGFVNLSGEYDDDGGTSRGKTRPVAVNFATNNPGLAAQLPNYPGPVQIWGSSPSHGYKLLFNSALEVTDNSKIYLFVNVAHSKADESFNYRAPVGSSVPLAIDNGTGVPATSTPGANGSFAPIYLTACPAANATCPAGGWVKSNLANTQQTFLFNTVYPAGFTPRFIGITDQAYGTLGYKGHTDSGFTYDLSGSVSRNTLDLSMNHSLNASFGPTSVHEFHFGKLIQKEIDGNLDLTYPIDAGFASPITLSGGLEYRKETYEQTAGDTQSYAAGPYAVQNLYVETAPGVYAFNSTVTKSPGASGYGGTSPASAGSFDQTSHGAYLGLEGDLTNKFSMGLAARYEHYSSFGDAFVTKLNAIWHITDTFAIRGTVGTGFHAPSPGQNNDEILTTNFVAGNQVQTGTYPVTSAIAKYYGAVSLKPEKSTNYGAGFVFKPNGALSLTVDWYSIKVTNRIGVSQNFNVTAGDIVAQPALLAVGVGGAVNYFTNGFSTRTSGVDVVGSYRTELGGGKLNLTLAYNYNKSKVLPGFNAAVIAQSQIWDIAHLAPTHRANFTANWQSGNFTLNLAERYYGSWSDANDYPINGSGGAIGQTFGAKFTTDLDVSYEFMDHVTLTVGANNLFNTYPDKIRGSIANPIYAITGSTADGQVYPRSGGPFGINGGLWYARIRIKY
jgi:iron complex outermembrane receptor protein